MEKAPLFLAVATVLGGTWLLLKGMEQGGSGGGQITTDDMSEGTIFDMNGLANQLTAATSAAPTGNPSSMSPQGLALLKQREGFSATKYPDHKGYSVGFGHLIRVGERLDTVTMEQASALLAADVAWAESSVYSTISVPLAQAQFDALTSFAFNVGAPAFERSTLARKINTGDPSASQEFDRWIYASGQVNSALVQRRAGERQQFESATA